MVVEFIEQINTRDKAWKDLVKSERVQGASMIRQRPDLLSLEDKAWLDNEKDGYYGKVLERKESDVIRAYIKQAFEHRPITSDAVDVINKGLVELGLPQLKNASSYDTKIDQALQWVKHSSAAASLGQGFSLKISYIEPAEAKEVEGEVSSADRTEKTGVSIIIMKGGKEVYANDLAQSLQEKSSADEEAVSKDDAKEKTAEELAAEKQAAADKGVAEKFACYIQTKLDALDLDVVKVKAYVAAMSDAKATLAEYALASTKISGIESQIAKVAKVFGEKELPKKYTAPKSFRKTGEEVKVTEFTKPEGFDQEPNESLKQLEALHVMIEKGVESTVFAGMTLESAAELVEVVRLSLISDFSAFKEEVNIASTIFTENKTHEDKLDAVLKDITDAQEQANKPVEPKSDADNADNGPSSPTAGEANGTADAEAKEALANKNKQFDEKIELLAKVRDLKQQIRAFSGRKSDVEQYRDDIKAMKSASSFKWLRSLFDSRRAIAMPLIATVLAAVTAGAGALIASAYASSIVYSVAASLAIYAAARFVSIMRISRFHDVKMSDLSVNALRYTSRLEIAATILPIATYVAAPFVFAGGIAAQVMAYCSSIAMRAVYAAISSLTVHQLEVSDNSNSAPQHFPSELFAPEVESSPVNASKDVLESVQAAFKGSSVVNVEVKPAEEGKELPTNVVDATKVLAAARAGSIEEGQLLSIPTLLGSIKPESEDLKGIEKIAALRTALLTINAKFKSVRHASETEAKASEADANAREHFYNNYHKTAIPTN